MSFDLDDPLAGILSDGSDDSFFDDDILGKKKPVKKKTTPISEKKNALFDLGDSDKPKPAALDVRKESFFDLGLPDNKKVPPVADDTDFIKSISKSPSLSKKSVTLSRESIKTPADSKAKQSIEQILSKSPSKSKMSASTDKIDITEPKKEVTKPLVKGKSSQSLLDDILGGPSQGTSQATRPATAATKNQDYSLDSILGKSEPKLSFNVGSTKNIAQKQTVKTEGPKEDNTKKTKASGDWLGIFQNKEFDNEEGDDAGMPAWLMGDAKKKNRSDDTKRNIEKEPLVKEVHKEIDDQERKTNEPIAPIEKEKQPITQIDFDSFTKTVPSTNIFRGNNDDITSEGASLYLQQQESQLMVAMQLKAQEERLSAMQIRQKEVQRVQREAAHAHRAQLDAMLQRQAEQRQQMQAIISAHQERITQRIKALLDSASNVCEDNPCNNTEGEYHMNTETKTESPHVREKKQLLQLVQSLQENHDKEIDLMETSYRRQLAFLEVTVNQSEERMKEESDKIVKFYTEKISWLEEHHQLYKKLAEENLNSLTERHNSEKEMLRQQHLDNIKILQEHHAVLMENIKNAVKQEQVLIKDSASFSSDLQELVVDVKESKSQCQQILERVQSLTENTHRDTDRSLQVRETQISDMIQQLKKERENFESEKSENREMVKMLETRLKQMTTMIEDETAMLKQKRMEFEFEKATFNKQTEFAKNVLKKQDEELKMLKEDIQKEYQEKRAKIEEERAKAIKDSAAIAKEKASIQNLKQELEKTKAELQAQLEEVSEERSKLNLEKQQLHMEEQRIIAKSRDLDLLAKTAVEKQTQADKKYSEAEFIQRKYEDRIRRIQEHVVSLNAREKQIAKEKVALSRERLNLHNERKQIESRQQCSLCKSNQNMQGYNFDTTYGFPDTFLPVSRDYGGTAINSAMTAVEQEMAYLMGRNFSLRHTAIVGSHHDGYEDRTTGDDNVQATQSTHLESGAFKDYMDPKFMMLRLDVQQVLSNLDQNKKEDVVPNEQQHEE